MILLRRISLLFALIFCNCIIRAQCQDLNRSIILKHLALPGLEKERLYWIEQQINDSGCVDLYIERAWTLHRSGNLEAAFDDYNRIPEKELAATSFYNDYLLLLFETSRSESLPGRLDLPANVIYAAKLLHTNVSPDSMQEEKDFYRLNDIYEDYREVRKKSVLVTALLSIVPAAGKYYLGRRSEAGFYLRNQAFTLIPLIESLVIFGPGSAVFIGSIVPFAIVYLGGIYGTVSTLIKEKHDRREQLRLEITEHLLRDFSNYPH